MGVEWLSIFLSAFSSGLLSLLISHAEQMERMMSQHAEQLSVLRTTLLAVEKDSGVEAARDAEGKLTGGLHHEGQFIDVPAISPSAVAGSLGSSERLKDKDPQRK